ncbi:Malolactic regulator [Streptococcus oralis]|uniref:Malolactic regulator n=1 Tax=Streptococcus oralis TaxID=1303 RepID=A0A139RN07_STROR|nr:LysR family transcriptional regulator [Streptococcus oralis]KXU16123.1 Malolactic regulator [Streptococcus oralis]
MNTRDLEYFVQLAESKSFTEVAQHFHVSQPTITYAIKRLEEKFGTTLVEKTTANRVDHLTQTGHILAGHARQIMQDLSKLEKAMEHARLGKIEVGFPPIIMNEFFEHCPSAPKNLNFLRQFHLICGGSQELRKRLLEGDLDFSLLGSLRPLNLEQVITVPLYRRELVLLVSKEHSLAQQREVAFQDLLSEDFILLDEHNIHLTAFDALNKRNGGRAKVATQLDNLPLIKKMVAENLGVTILTASALSKLEKDLVAIPFVPQEKIYFHVAYAYSPELYLTEELKEFMALLDTMKE